MGQTRVIVRFLFLPRKIENEWRWLEFASIRQKAVGRSMIGEPASGFSWMDACWLTP